MTPARNPTLLLFRQRLAEAYGDRLQRVVLFGSHARGEATPDSDYDVAIFLGDFRDRWTEIETLTPIVTDFLSDLGVFIHAMPYRAGAEHERTPLMHELRRDGIEF